MYEDRFGTEENPIFVPCLESERIIGVTDPEDDNLVVGMAGLSPRSSLAAPAPPSQQHQHSGWGLMLPGDLAAQVWGILRESEGPRQFIENGEYYVLKRVPYIMKVGDILDQLEAGSNKPLDK
ncbi:hypothetical protein QJQ45_012582 [Haematococcus lacustris]|nr:hypothetical protein QJQ45_012582 [Haematococcus lacustris]